MRQTAPVKPRVNFYTAAIKPNNLNLIDILNRSKSQISKGDHTNLRVPVLLDNYNAYVHNLDFMYLL